MDHLLSREKFDKTLRRIIYHPTVESSCLQEFVKVRRFIAVTFLRFNQAQLGSRESILDLIRGVLYLRNFSQKEDS
jgi:hypothetical protein